MSKSYRILTSIVLISMLALPAFFIMGVWIPLTLYDLITTHINGSSTFFTILGILILIAHLAPPPPDKKKRILFVYQFKDLLKKFCKLKEIEEFSFKDDIVHFANYQYLTETINSKKVKIQLKLRHLGGTSVTSSLATEIKRASNIDNSLIVENFSFNYHRKRSFSLLSKLLPGKTSNYPMIFAILSENSFYKNSRGGHLNSGEGKWIKKIPINHSFFNSMSIKIRRLI